VEELAIETAAQTRCYVGIKFYGQTRLPTFRQPWRYFTHRSVFTL